MDWMLESVHSPTGLSTWDTLSTDSVHASSVNMFNNRIDKYATLRTL